MKRQIIETFRLYWQKRRGDYVHAATGRTRSELMKAAKDQFFHTEVTYPQGNRNVCTLTIYAWVGGGGRH